MVRRSGSAEDSSAKSPVPSPAERYAAARRRAAIDRGELGAFRRLLDFELDDFQVQACAAVERGSGVLVAAPTGAGKTVVGEFAVHLALAQGKKAFYTTPIKALSNQKFHDLVRRHGPEQVGLLTGDSTVNSEAPVVVMTTEVLRNMVYAGSQTLDHLGFVVMDEVHYLADRFRGPVWEEVILHLSAEVQLVSLSATVSNAEEFGDWLTTVRGNTAVVVSEHRPVPLGQLVLIRDRLLDLYAGHVDPTDPGQNPPINPDLAHELHRTSRADDAGLQRRQRGRGDRGYRGPGGRRPGSSGSMAPGLRPASRPKLVGALDDGGLLPAIVFIFSRAGCDGAVQQCLAGGVQLTSPAEQAEIQLIAEERCAAISAEDLDVVGYWGFVDALTRGVAAHHAGMLPAFKETVEAAFTRGLVKVVFATETLALGINMPARSVVLEKLVKWNGSAHTDLTPGEYTQLTGRAGRRGIDHEGHAVVVGRSGLDPVALAGLASKRLYPLRSAFRPTYNMAVNLISQVGVSRSREVLETSFAQFQADRGVVGLARQAQQYTETISGYAEAMTCGHGDFAAYAALRREISEAERGEHRARAAHRRSVAEALGKLRRGDVIVIPGGRRPGHAVVIASGSVTDFGDSLPLVLTTDADLRRPTVRDMGAGVTVEGWLRLPPKAMARSQSERKHLAAELRELIAETDAQAGSAPTRRDRRGPHVRDEDDAIATLRRRLRDHPCHSCPEREQHARWAERWYRTTHDREALVRKIEGRTGSIAVVFDRICDVLLQLDYLGRDTDEIQVKASGQWLRRLYAENDLLLAECLRRGAWGNLDVPGLAAMVSAVVFSARRDDRQPEQALPGGHNGLLSTAVRTTTAIWSELDDLEQSKRLSATQPLDLGIVTAVHRWAAGRSLDVVLRDADLAAGDFVRWCKQVVDVLDQVVQAAPDPRLREVARKAIPAVRRGVVADGAT